MMRRLLAALAILSLAFAVTARAQVDTKPGKSKASKDGPELRGDSKVLVTDSLARQQALKRAFESFRQRLAILANRLEGGSDADKEKAKSLKKAIAVANELGTEAKFDSMIRLLGGKDSHQSLDALKAVMKDNAELRVDLKKIIALLAKDENASKKEETDKMARLLEQLKDLIAKQERVRAQTEMGRKDNKALEKDQNKVTKETKEAATGKKDGDEKKDAEAKGEAKGEGKPGAEAKGEGKDDTKTKAEGKAAEGKDGKPDNNKGEGKPGEGKPSDGKEGKPGDGKPGDGKGMESKDGKAGEGKGGEGKPGDGKGEGKPGMPGKGDGKPSAGKGEGKPGDGKAGAGKPGKGEGKPSGGKPGEGKPGAGEGKPGKGEGKPGDPKGGAGKGDPKGGEGKPGGKGEGKPSAGKPGDGKPGEGKPSGGMAKGGEGKPGGKPSEGKPSEGKGKAEGKGEGKPGAGKPSEGKPSEGKPGAGKPGAGKPGQGKPGEGKPGGGSPPPPGGDDQPKEENPVKKQLEEAEKYQKQAEDDLKKKDNPKASDNQGKAIDELEKAKKKLEELLKQAREEELERLLADLEKRCRYMLALQIEVRDGTVVLDKDIVKSGSPPDVGHAGRSNKLGDKEEEILREASASLKLIKTEGSAVAFAEVFEQVSKDMEAAMNRLRKTDTGAVTVRIENDIIDTLKEMIEALKKAQKEAKSPPPGKPGQPPPPGPQNKSLIDKIAELKMIYAMQKRVNGRTELYGKEYKGEQLTPPAADAAAKEREKYEMIKGELKDLSDRQQKIGKVTKDIATGKTEGGAP